MERWQGKPFQTEGPACAKARRQESRFKASVAGLCGPPRGLWPSDVGATGGLWAEVGSPVSGSTGSSKNRKPREEATAW